MRVLVDWKGTDGPDGPDKDRNEDAMDRCCAIAPSDERTNGTDQQHGHLKHVAKERSLLRVQPASGHGEKEFSCE